VAVTVLLIMTALAVGVAGGYWLPGLGFGAKAAGGPAVSRAIGEDEDQWYTCGMHPNVLQKGPGLCPICQMKLTPLKKDADAQTGGQAGDSKERKILYWRAPMDPNYVSEQPGKSPMGMDLVPVYADEGDSPSAHAIRIDPITVQNMGIRTAVIQRGPLIKAVRTVGRVDYDERRVTFIDTKFNGWIEKLNVDITGQVVAQGDPLFDVYSPELYAAQEEYLAAVRNLPLMEKSDFAPAREQAVQLVEAAATKLKYLDVSDAQIETLKTVGKIEKSLTIYSPSNGIVTEKMALEGMYVKPGMRLYTIADLSRVWVYADIYEYQLPWIRLGQTANMTLSYIPGEKFVGKVFYIYPYLEKKTRVIQVRLEFDNPALELKPGMFANVELEAELQKDAILVPREAYIDSGTRQVAFVNLGEGKFSPRDIQVGVEAEDGMVEVLYGLDAGEVVVTSGQFMLDAESKLKEAVAKMMEVESTQTTKRPAKLDMSASHTYAHERVDDHAGHDGKYAMSMPADAAYACPMETHPAETDPANQGPYFSAEPGECPRCGMTLKLLGELDWAQARLATQGGQAAYTCPTHQHVFADEPGPCPRCGEPLMPFKVMYTCPNPQHAGHVAATPGNCPECGQGLATFRSVWLDPAMAQANVPPNPGLAELAPWRCPLHPLVHSDRPARCTICGAALQATQLAAAEPPTSRPTSQTAPAEPAYTCPMHPDKIRAQRPGPCSICGMQLVHVDALTHPEHAIGHVAVQMNYIMEHYLELQQRLASDRTTGVALHALGLAAASEELAKLLEDPATELPADVAATAEQLHAATLKTTGADLAEDRVAFVEISAMVQSLVEHVRPDLQRWPKLYIYHCPMSNGNWLQPNDNMANPYYGFKMLKCGKLQNIR
jgi:Cu(I)/Ag(I) efflux system membrane fusion protein/cobalt-zinc-cadmium efflux system membrane fusion protein